MPKLLVVSFCCLVLNVPTKAHESTILAIGGCSGADVDKFETLGLATCPPGWAPLRPLKRKHGMSKKDLRDADVYDAASGCVALVCSVVCQGTQASEYTR